MSDITTDPARITEAESWKKTRIAERAAIRDAMRAGEFPARVSRHILSHTAAVWRNTTRVMPTGEIGFVLMVGEEMQRFRMPLASARMLADALSEMLDQEAARKAQSARSSGNPQAEVSKSAPTASAASSSSDCLGDVYGPYAASSISTTNSPSSRSAILNAWRAVRHSHILRNGIDALRQLVCRRVSGRGPIRLGSRPPIYNQDLHPAQDGTAPSGGQARHV